MADVLRETNFSVRCVIGRTGSQGNVFVYDIFPKDAEVVIGGLAIDIGTTTVSALLIDMISGDILGKASSGMVRSVMEQMLSTESSNLQNLAEDAACRKRLLMKQSIR